MPPLLSSNSPRPAPRGSQDSKAHRRRRSPGRRGTSPFFTTVCALGAERFNVEHKKNLRKLEVGIMLFCFVFLLFRRNDFHLLASLIVTIPIFRCFGSLFLMFPGNYRRHILMWMILLKILKINFQAFHALRKLWRHSALTGFTSEEANATSSRVAYGIQLGGSDVGAQLQLDQVEKIQKKTRLNMLRTNHASLGFLFSTGNFIFSDFQNLHFFWWSASHAM